jgi:DNA polymerase-3 subunit beta
MVIPRDNDKRIVADSRAFAESVRRAAVMADEKLRAVRLSFRPGEAEITASSADAGEAHEVLEVGYQGAELSIGFNPQYILEFLQVCGTETFSFLLRDGETQGMLGPEGAADVEYRYVVMPMKF